jgi:hypothetical protein
MGNPPAHRRLVPRVPKKEPAPEDLEVTSERVIVIEEQSDIDLPKHITPPPRHLPIGSSTDLADESLEMTAVRDNFVPVDELDEMTAQRRIEPVFDEFDDAGETSAHIPKRETLAQMLADKAVPQFDDVGGPLIDNGPDANAFSDFEPTALKTPHNPDAEDRPMTHVSPAERGLLAAMSEGHEASRMVYVNWLERRGEVVRAEFLRLDCVLAQMSPQDPRYAGTRRRLLELAPRISLDWRSRVARSLIEGCGASANGCPSYWRALPSDSDDMRSCTACGQQVFYCVTIDLARARVAAGQRVAVDLTVDRYHGDLESRCTSCRSAVPQGTRFCPHCGRSQF